MLMWMVALVFSGSSVKLNAAETQPPFLAPARAAGVPVTATGVSTNSTNTSYVLGVNDLIRVAVYKEPDLETVTRVDQDGTVSLPLIRAVKVGGRSVAEARDVLRQLYERDYLVSADVTVTVVQSSQTNKPPEVVVPKQKFTILGYVKKSGNIEMPPNEKVDIVQAIGMAEGFTGVANQENVTVMRKSGTKTEKFTLDVKAMMRDLKAKPFEIKPGDVIEVRQTIF